MKISFENPIIILFIPLIIFFIILFSRNIKYYSKFKKVFFITIRSIICILLILSISDMKILKITDNLTNVFVIDNSASNKNVIDKYKQMFIDAKEYKENNMYDGVVTFGSNAVIEKNVSKEDFDWNFKSYVYDDSTNIDEALKLSSSLFNDNTAKRIILFSDGNENVGDAIKQANILKSKNIVVDAYIPEMNIENEVQLTSINVDKYINKNINYEVAVIIDSLCDTEGILKLYKDDLLIYNNQININKGNNRFIINDISKEGGNVIYKAIIEPSIDTYVENNQIYESCYIEDIPSILILQENDSARELEKILKASKLNVVTMDSKSAPTNIEQLQKYNSIIISDVNIENISDEFLNSLDFYVKSLGGGLLVTGGENSFALGGYFGTNLEKMLPINMQIKTEGENPNLGIIFVVDNSGSMMNSEYGVSTMEIAKEAIIRSIETLNKEDILGVLSFDDLPSWVYEPSLLENNESIIKDKVAKIQPAGGTSILPALEEAYSKLKDVNSKLKHIILLTDGQAERNGYDSLMNDMESDNITLSTVAIGDGADTQLLERLANEGRGRYYFTNVFTDLPKVLLNETYIAGKDYINNKEFYPETTGNFDIISDIEEVPKLYGYISSSIKQGADMILQTDENEPLLATWQYGLGRTSVWTSDVNGKWTSDWLSSENGLKVFRNVISWILKKEIFNDIKVNAEISGNETLLRLEMPLNKEIKDINGKIISFDNKEYDINFETISSGILQSKFDDIREGSYIINLAITYNDMRTDYVNTSFNIHYPLEYDITKLDNGKSLINKIVNITGGKIINSKEDIYKGDISKVYSYIEINNILLILALLIFIFDVFVRRFYFISNKIEEIYFYFVNKISFKKFNINKTILSVSNSKSANNLNKKEIDTKSKEKDIILNEYESMTKMLLNNKKNRRK